MPVGLGHALSRPASQGGKAKHETLDAHQIAVLLRGGRLPPASGYPAERRATSDLLRCHRPLMRQRAARLADKVTRGGGAERLPAPAVQQRLAVDLTLLDTSDRLRTDRALPRGKTAQAPEAPTFSRLRSLPGLGNIFALV